MKITFFSFEKMSRKYVLKPAAFFSGIAQFFYILLFYIYYFLYIAQFEIFLLVKMQKYPSASLSAKEENCEDINLQGGFCAFL